MFRIVCDPSSGSMELYLTEITRSFGSYVIHHQGVWSCTWLKLFVVSDPMWSIIREYGAVL